MPTLDFPAHLAYRPYHSLKTNRSSLSSLASIHHHQPTCTPTPTPTPTSTPPPPPPSTEALSKPHPSHYRPSHQLNGVSRSRSDLFVSARRAREESKRLEENKLQKRLHRLIDLHFPPPSPFDPLATPTALNNLSTHYLSTLRVVSQPTLRVREQAIVRWQEDARVKKCSICAVPFTLRVRKHHCRLCGKVVCFLAPSSSPSTISNNPLSGLIAATRSDPRTSSERRDRCSTFITFEWDSLDLIRSRLLLPAQDFPLPEKAPGPTQEVKYQGRVVELTDEEMGTSDDHSSVFDLMTATGPPKRDPLQSSQPNKSLSSLRPKGVRVCRECLAVVLRRQAMIYPLDQPDYLKLYHVLKHLQDEIERMLPEFKDIIVASRTSGSNPLNLSPKPSAPPYALLNLRKQLLTNLSLYDTTSKRIAHLPSANSEARLQKAIVTRAAFFLRDHMSLIRTLGAFGLDHQQQGIPSSSSSSSLAMMTGRRNNRTLSSTSLANGRQSLSAILSSPPQQQSPHHKTTNATTTNSSQQLNPPEPPLLRRLDRSRSPSSSSPPQPSASKDLIRLNVLLEQECLVEGYFAQANARRQLEDAASLKLSLDELRQEIHALKISLNS